MNTHQIGVKAIIEREDTILIIKRSERYKPVRYRDLAETWDLPGGRLEVGEGLEEGLEREVKEEVGLRVKNIKDVLEIKTAFRNKEEHIVRITYICSAYEGEVILSGEHISAGWIKREEVIRLQYKDNLLKDTLKKYLERTK